MAAPVIPTSFSNATAVSSSLGITKPSGLAVGDLLVALLAQNTSAVGGTAINTTAGWTSATSATTTDGAVSIQYKIADSGDVAAGSFTFTSTTSGIFVGSLLRVTGNRSTGFAGPSEADTGASTATISFTGASTPTVDNCLAVMIFTGLKTNNGVGTIGSYTSTPSMSWTELYDTSTDNGSDIDNITGTAWANLATATQITNYGATLSLSKAQVLGAMATFYPNVDAQGTNTLLSVSPTTFSQNGVASTQGTNALLAVSPTLNTQSGRATTPTQWTAEPKPSTTWTSET